MSISIIKYKIASLAEDVLAYLKGKSVLFLGWSLAKRLAAGSAFFIVLVAVSVWLGWGDDSTVLDSAGKEIVEEVDMGEGGFLGRVLPAESPLTSARLFAGSLESRISDIFGGGHGKVSAVLGGPDEDGAFGQLETVAGSALVAQLPALAIIPASGYGSFEDGDILTYEVEEGDSLKSIADDFGVSVETLLSANNLSARTKLKPGDKLSILPIDGAVHVVKAGETVQGLALKYKAEAARIIAFNDLAADGRIKPGDTLIIPGGEFHAPISPQYAPVKSPPPQSLPNITGYYGRPANGRLTYGLHRFNAVDIGGKEWCNTPLYAAAAGTVVTADAQGWNGGYGRYVKIAHDNGTITLYAHASQLLVGIGQVVNKSQPIGLMGSTGRATGCHVHFEIRGARNPFAS